MKDKDLLNTRERGDESHPEAIENSVTYGSIKKGLEIQNQKAQENLQWLFANMHPYFFITMREETDAIIHLAERLHHISREKEIVLSYQDKKLILAQSDTPGSIYETLKTLREQEISYAEMSHSYSPIPCINRPLEILKFEFNRKSYEDISETGQTDIPLNIRKSVLAMMRRLYPDFDFDAFDSMLRLFWLNNEDYMRISPPKRIARVLHLYQEGKRHDGFYLDVETKEDNAHHKESRLLFSVGNPPQLEFLTQIGEIFQRLDIGLRRSYCLIINTGVHTHFLGTFYVLTRRGELVEKGGSLFEKLRSELYNSQILSNKSPAYRDFVVHGIMTGEEASLNDAFIAFCHTALSHNQPDRFGFEFVKEAFHSEPNLALKLIDLFRKKFDPDIKKRKPLYDRAFEEAGNIISAYNSGHRHLDESRKTVFRACLLFIQYTLKTNFFVPEKHALAFRMDPAFLAELGPDFISDLPEATPFRITFFFTRQAQGYHVGFSDIARGGWRTIVCKTHDEHSMNTITLFREVFVLAHTQHLKNKDIYQGGSKLTILMDATDLDEQQSITQRMYKVQYGVINAFLDLFVTENGRAKDIRVVDYYGEEEPIELGPDENMHDSMIEIVARQAVKRDYLLGIGIISSKHVGINHKEYGVTSRGVIKFAERAMKEVGIDMKTDPFSIKITGGPSGDVAGNAMALILKRFPNAEIRVIIDGTAGLYDPKGVSRAEISKILLKHDLDRLDPECLHSGGFMIFRHMRRKEGFREVYRKVERTEKGIEEQWITSDELNSDMDNLVFDIPTDLFLPCGGRPETIDGSNWHRIIGKDKKPNVKVITEGANSFISPEARSGIQKMGVVLIRDASANKCGVISSSYEVIANLIMTEAEFLTHKEEYVTDVLRILEKRAGEEADLIFKRYHLNQGAKEYTEISNAISKEINDYYNRFFNFFQDHPDLVNQMLYKKTLLHHLPAFIQKNKKFINRLGKIPNKIKYAILASEIATMIVYHQGWEMDFEERLKSYLKENLVEN